MSQDNLFFISSTDSFFLAYLVTEGLIDSSFLQGVLVYLRVCTYTHTHVAHMRKGTLASLYRMAARSVKGHGGW